MCNHDSHALAIEMQFYVVHQNGIEGITKSTCEPGTHNVGPSGSILEIFQCRFWQGKQILMQVIFLPNTMETFKAEYIHPHDSLLIDNDLSKQPVPAGHHGGHSAS